MTGKRCGPAQGKGAAVTHGHKNSAANGIDNQAQEMQTIFASDALQRTDSATGFLSAGGLYHAHHHSTNVTPPTLPEGQSRSKFAHPDTMAQPRTMFPVSDVSSR